MSDRILKALMQLFAIVANTDEVGLKGREIVERFLKRQLTHHFVLHYLAIYDEFLENLKGKSEEGRTRKRTSVNSVKVLRICTEINRELDQKQKIIVLIRLYEFVNSALESAEDQHTEFLNTVAETFSISEADKNDCAFLVHAELITESIQKENFLVIDGNKDEDKKSFRHIYRENLNGRLVFLMLKDPQLFIFTYIGSDQIYLDAREITPDSVYIFEPGSVIRGSKLNPVYNNDIIHNFLGFNIVEKIKFDVVKLGFSFKKNKIALHDLTFSSSSKNLVGIMGNSGAGKTTLLNLLNGSAVPAKGKILINGIDLYSDKDLLHGLIGNIPQDDLLIEELTVFQNLFYSSKLYFGDLNDEEITKRVDRCLQSLLLYEIKDLMVGDPLNKFISGGQRKRLNIALELIREPEILFVDEPTSGLSSNDAENVMDLLKQLTLSGKLIFVVIHQPSSEIFKLFDQMLILDTGGYPVYFGNPVDSVSYFKQQMNYADYENSECSECGNINPEEIFRILEAKTIDEFGKPTAERKIKSEEWFKLYNSLFHFKGEETHADKSLIENVPKVSSPFIQYLVYFKRNLFSKLNNTQYLAITLFEGPLLALILALALKSYNVGEKYSYGNNANIPVYIFICTIVALFLGLISSAEEIIQDKKILKRESFLQLSRNSYLLSKISFLFLISAVQSFLFLIVGNVILDFPGLFFHYFITLFTVSCFGNLLGLNISSGLKTRVAVYILIPFLIIPQIMLSGVMVKFEDLSPIVSKQSRVPLIGNIMASRWAYEGLAVDQFKNNRFETQYFDIDKHMNNADYRRAWWLPLMEKQIDKSSEIISKSDDADTLSVMNDFFKTEFSSLHEEYPLIKIEDLSSHNLASEKQKFLDICSVNLDSARHYLNKEFNDFNDKRDRLTTALTAKLGSDDAYNEFKSINKNDNLGDFVTNRKQVKNQVLVADNRVIRRFMPVYVSSTEKGLFDAPFYAYSKSFFGIQIETIWFNCIIVWLMSTLLYFVLYFDLLRKILER